MSCLPIEGVQSSAFDKGVVLSFESIATSGTVCNVFHCNFCKELGVYTDLFNEVGAGGRSNNRCHVLQKEQLADAKHSSQSATKITHSTFSVLVGGARIKPCWAD